MRSKLTLLLLALKIFVPSYSQVNYTANDQVPAYTTEFLYGTNPGYYNEFWNDIAKANIARGNGTPGCNIKTLRPSLPHTFLEINGYNARVAEFNHYKSIGMKDHTIFLNTYFKNGPNDAPSADFDIPYIKKYMDSTKYGTCGRYPQIFKNLHEPIWDSGENGTPVNDKNYFALYIYKTVSTYKGHGKFWEIYNEPDFCSGANTCGGDPNAATSWYKVPPDPCNLTNLYAPIFHYIRMLRIAYEVIKTVDPNSYVALGGIGYPAFLDAVFRYTDNPANGAVSSTYPLKGGAYFDVVSFHSYPQYSLQAWNNTKQGFDYFRYSDAVADTIASNKRGYERICTKYGYDGITYPKKFFICTEYNIPRKTYGTNKWIGSVAAQRNAMIKVLVRAQKEDIKQFYSFLLGDFKDESDATSTDWHDLMGLFKNLTPSTSKPYNQQFTETGKAFKTTATLLEGYRFDKARTTALALPSTVEGAAFKNADGKYRYVLWARTKTDLSEDASATYSFPTNLDFTSLTSYAWNYSVDNTQTSALLLSNIALTGTPKFFSEGSALGLDGEEMEISSAMSIYPNPSTGKFSVSVVGMEGNATLKIMGANGTLVSSEKIQLALGGTEIQSSNELPKGLYFIQVQSAKGTFAQKLFVE